MAFSHSDCKIISCRFVINCDIGYYNFFVHLPPVTKKIERDGQCGVKQFEG